MQANLAIILIDLLFSKDCQWYLLVPEPFIDIGCLGHERCVCREFQDVANAEVEAMRDTSYCVDVRVKLFDET